MYAFHRWNKGWENIYERYEHVFSLKSFFRNVRNVIIYKRFSVFKLFFGVLT